MTIRDRVEQSVRGRARHLDAIYEFVLRFRPATAKETIRARVYEAVADGALRRVAPGVYFARSGPATLLLVEGDARDVVERLESGSIDAIITDPPYDLGTRQHALAGTTRPHQGKGRTYAQWDLDEPTLRQLFRVLRKDKEWNTIDAGRRERADLPRGGGALFLFVPPISRSSWPHIRALIDLAERLGFVFYGTFTWDQEIMGMGYDCGRNRKTEILFFTAGPRNGLLWDLGLPNILRHKRLARRRGEHEAEKPVGLFWDLARAATRPGDVIADFFVGRGRHLLRLLDEGRHVLAVDRDAAWIARIRGDFRDARLG